MRWDLGVEGLAVLVAMALVFGAVTGFLFRASHGWLAGLLGTAAAFVLGAVVSEGLFGWATEAELQPNIGGLSFDETMLALVLGLIVVAVARSLGRRRTGAPA